MHKKTKCLLLVLPFIDIKFPLIGVAYLASFLKSNGYETKIEDLNTILNKDNVYDFEDDNFQEHMVERNIHFFKKWIKEIMLFEPTVIGFVAWPTNICVIEQISMLIKQYNKDIYIVCGGAYISEGCLMKTELIKSLSLNSINCFISGEGEQTLLAIVSSIEEGIYPINILGTTCVDLNNNIIYNPQREEEKNIDIFPFPYYGDYNFDKYLVKDIIPLTFSRGCKWKCKFCTVFAHWIKYRTRSAENIFLEICHRIKEFNRKQYNFVLCDCSCNQDLKMLDELCDLIINDNRTNGKVFFYSFAKILNMDFQLLVKMKKAGFVNLCFGLESASNNVLKKMYKPYKKEDAEKIIQQAYKAGIGVDITMIVGFPGETDEDFDETISFIERNFMFLAEIHFNFYMMTSVLRERFADVVDINDKRILEWESKNKENTFEIREKRLLKVENMLITKFHNIKKDGMRYINTTNKKNQIRIL